MCVKVLAKLSMKTVYYLEISFIVWGFYTQSKVICKQAVDNDS